MTRLTKLALAGLVVMLVLGTGIETTKARQPDFSDREISIVATTGMIGDIVEIVGGDRVNVTTLMGPGIDPHLYRASAGDVSRLAEADLVFYNGLHLEAQLADVFERMGDRVTTVAVAEAIPTERLIVVGEGDATYDPHVWFDVELWSIAVEAVRDTLMEVDPTHADGYEERAAAYLEELAELDHYVAEQAASIPEQQRVLITAHDAFGYFAGAYGFEVLGLQGISTVSEAGAGDVQALADLIVERQIPAIFVETSVSPRSIRALQEAVASRGYEVAIGGELFSDAMGDPGTPEGTYIGMVRHNIDTIVGALRDGEAETPETT
jgi:manganese/zinc/iron transport system substrate-binding protein